MKLVFAIVHDEDVPRVVNELSVNGFGVTKLFSTGGFLKSGNTTLLTGIDNKKVNRVIDIIKMNSKSRKQVFNSPVSSDSMEGMHVSHPIEALTGGAAKPCHGMEGIFSSYPIEVDVGGATIFVMDVEKFRKF